MLPWLTDISPFAYSPYAIGFLAVPQYTRLRSRRATAMLRLLCHRDERRHWHVAGLFHSRIRLLSGDVG